LGQVAARLTMLDVACNRCDRRGRLRLDRLLAGYKAQPSAKQIDIRRRLLERCREAG
jgi:hypothetical protein